MKIRRCDSPSFSKSRNVEEQNSKSIPLDLVIEILLRLPAKSTARLRCVSKLWSSTLHSSDFTKSFFTRSLSRPKLLFTCLKDGKAFFFTSHQPEDASSITVSCHMSFPISNGSQTYRPVHGLVCGLDQQKIKVSVPLVCNPSTGQYLILPKVKTQWKEVISYLGYVPITKQFKVLCMSYSNGLPCYCDFQVLTLGTGKELSWKSIQCGIHHERLDYGYGRPHPREYDGICINGILYYLAFIWEEGPGVYSDVICFEFESEKFKCIRHDQGMRKHLSIELSTLVNYKGKLAMLQLGNVDGMYSYEVWVLQDAEKHEWSSYVYAWPSPVLPPPRKKKVVDIKLCFVGMTDTGEIVLAPSIISESYYLLYYNPERKTWRRVEILGMEAFKGHKAYTFLDHIEDVKPIASV